jgi:hypothetical protein
LQAAQPYRGRCALTVTRTPPGGRELQRLVGAGPSQDQHGEGKINEAGELIMMGDGQPDEVDCRGARRDTTGALALDRRSGFGTTGTGAGLRSAAVVRSTTSEL